MLAGILKVLGTVAKGAAVAGATAAKTAAKGIALKALTGSNTGRFLMGAYGAGKGAIGLMQKGRDIYRSAYEDQPEIDPNDILPPEYDDVPPLPSPIEAPEDNRPDAQFDQIENAQGGAQLNPMVILGIQSRLLLLEKRVDKLEQKERLADVIEEQNIVLIDNRRNYSDFSEQRIEATQEVADNIDGYRDDLRRAELEAERRRDEAEREATEETPIREQQPQEEQEEKTSGLLGTLAGLLGMLAGGTLDMAGLLPSFMKPKVPTPKTKPKTTLKQRQKNVSTRSKAEQKARNEKAKKLKEQRAKAKTTTGAKPTAPKGLSPNTPKIKPNTVPVDEAIEEVGKKTAKPATKAGTEVTSEVAEQAVKKGGMTIGKVFGTAMRTVGVAIGPILTAAMATMEWQDLTEQARNGEITGEEEAEQKRNLVISESIAAGGSALVGALGAAGGTLIFPVGGTIIGGAVGGLVGYFAGDAVAEEIIETLDEQGDTTFLGDLFNDVNSLESFRAGSIEYKNIKPEVPMVKPEITDQYDESWKAGQVERPTPLRGSAIPGVSKPEVTAAVAPIGAVDSYVDSVYPTTLATETVGTMQTRVNLKTSEQDTVEKLRPVIIPMQTKTRRAPPPVPTAQRKPALSTSPIYNSTDSFFLERL